jgi:hypothetical protein
MESGLVPKKWWIDKENGKHIHKHTQTHACTNEGFLLTNVKHTHYLEDVSELEIIMLSELNQAQEDKTAYFLWYATSLSKEKMHMKITMGVLEWEHSGRWEVENMNKVHAYMKVSQWIPFKIARRIKVVV